MNLSDQIIPGFVLAAVLMLLLFGLALKRNQYAVVDLGWAGGVGMLVLFGALTLEGISTKGFLIAFAGILWSTRLATHIWKWRIKAGHEDGRYLRMKNHWGSRAPIGFLLFFLAQAPLMVLFALPILFAAGAAQRASAFQVTAALAVWLTAVLGEGLSDRQLERFRSESKNKGKVCDSGFWAWSRHPNYFFEWLHWWTYVIVSIGSPWWGLTLLGPALMFLFLFRVTGIPHTEKQAAASRGEAYRRYQQRTSVFFPWPPKKVS